MTKRVWILGAGFSRPLGGPLLNDVLSMRSWRHLAAKWPHLFGALELLNQSTLAQVYGLFHYGMGFPEGAPFDQDLTGQGASVFRHAEDFLVRLDAAKEEEGRRFMEQIATSVADVLSWKGIEGPSWLHNQPLAPTEDLVRAAIKIMALECEAFVYGVDSTTEPAWGPFRNWAGTLSQEDTIVTFNYDRVIEVLRPGKLLRVVGVEGEHDDNAPALCKMHGSLDWYLHGEPKGFRTAVSGNLADAIIHNPLYEPAIGIPGRAKDELAKSAFEPVWSAAEQALIEADEVYIVGYSLPESDAWTRERLLRSLRQNQKVDLTVTIALGEPSFSTKRLEAMLRMSLPNRVDPKKIYATRTLRIDTQELWAQDLLEAYATKSGRLR